MSIQRQHIPANWSLYTMQRTSFPPGRDWMKMRLSMLSGIPSRKSRRWFIRERSPMPRPLPGCLPIRILREKISEEWLQWGRLALLSRQWRNKFGSFFDWYSRRVFKKAWNSICYREDLDYGRILQGSASSDWRT